MQCSYKTSFYTSRFITIHNQKRNCLEFEKHTQQGRRAENTKDGLAHTSSFTLVWSNASQQNNENMSQPKLYPGYVHMYRITRNLLHSFPPATYISQ
jgi:hypothetical protein